MEDQMNQRPPRFEDIREELTRLLAEFGEQPGRHARVWEEHIELVDAVRVLEACFELDEITAFLTITWRPFDNLVASDEWEWLAGRFPRGLAGDGVYVIPGFERRYQMIAFTLIDDREQLEPQLIRLARDILPLLGDETEDVWRVTHELEIMLGDEEEDVFGDYLCLTSGPEYLALTADGWAERLRAIIDEIGSQMAKLWEWWSAEAAKRETEQ